MRLDILCLVSAKQKSTLHNMLRKGLSSQVCDSGLWDTPSNCVCNPSTSWVWDLGPSMLLCTSVALTCVITWQNSIFLPSNILFSNKVWELRMHTSRFADFPFASLLVLVSIDMPIAALTPTCALLQVTRILTPVCLSPMAFAFSSKRGLLAGICSSRLSSMYHCFAWMCHPIILRSKTTTSGLRWRSILSCIP